MSNFDHANFVVGPNSSKDLDLLKEPAPVSPLDLNLNFDYEEACITFDMRESYLQH